MYILSIVTRGAVKWTLSLLTLSACVEVFCWSSKCLRIVQGCVLTFRREKINNAFSLESQCIGYAYLFVCICWNIKVQVQNACNVFSVFRQQRALCSLSTLKVEMFNIKWMGNRNANMEHKREACTQHCICLSTASEYGFGVCWCWKGLCFH